METRNQWYKPNLLYNIHWIWKQETNGTNQTFCTTFNGFLDSSRTMIASVDFQAPKRPSLKIKHTRPPKAPETQMTPEQQKTPVTLTTPEPPMAPEPPTAPETLKRSERPIMIVKTVRFNPSVCTCGEHDCKPHYRMERNVLWIGKERSKGTKDKVKRENGFEIREHLELQSLKQIDINVFKEEKSGKEKGSNDSSENKTADGETDHIDRKGLRESGKDKDNKELKAKINNQSIGHDRGGDNGLKTKKDNFGKRGDSLGNADDDRSSDRRSCFKREHINEDDAKLQVSFNIVTNNREFENDEENNVDFSEDLDERADRYSRDDKSAGELCFYEDEGNVEGQEQIASDFNSYTACDFFEKGIDIVSGPERNSQVGADSENDHVGCESAKTKDICQEEQNEDGCVDFKGDDENCNGTDISVDFNDSKCDGSSDGYRESTCDDNVCKNENESYARDCMRNSNKIDDYGGQCDDAAEDGDENDVDLKMLNSDDHYDISMQDDLSVQDGEQIYQEDEISSNFGILSIYCNSEIHFMVESTWGRNKSYTIKRESTEHTT